MSGVQVPKIQVFDPQSGAPLDVPENQVPGLAAQGKVTFQKGDQIPVQDSAGVTGTVPSEEAQRAFQQGYSIQPLESRQKSALQDQFGGAEGETKAALAALARGASLGTSDYALTKLGMVDPDTLQNLKDANPGISTAGELGGAVAPALLSGGESLIGTAAELAPAAQIGKVGAAATRAAESLLGSEGTQTLAAKIARTVVPKAAGYATEGALYTAGNVLSESALGDPNEVAHHALADIGMGALIGGVFGVGVEGGASGLLKLFGSRVTNEAAEVAARTQVAEGAADAALASAPIEKPGSLAEIQQRVAAAKASGESVELPQKSVLLDAENLLSSETKYPVTEAQIQSLDNPTTRDIYGAVRESSTAEGQALREYEGLQKKESVDLLNGTVKNLAPTGQVTADPVHAGEKLVGAFTDQYESEQKDLGTVFRKFDDKAPNVKVNSLDVIDAIKKVLPEADSALTLQNGAIQLRPYNVAEMGMSEEAYGAIKHIFEPLTGGDLNVQGLRNIRSTLDKFVKSAPGQPGYGSQMRMVSGLKREMLDIMTQKMDEAVPGLNARDVFKRYAQNEQGRGYVEKLLGGSISDRAGLLKQIAPEKVGDRLFRDTVAVKAAKEILPADAWNQMRANYLAEQVSRFTDKNVFSSQRFAGWLKTNASELREAFSDRPDVLSRIQALSDRMRILPDAASINPSGTAKTIDLLQKISKIGKSLQHPESIPGKLVEWGAEKLEGRNQLSQLDDILANRYSVSEKQQSYGVLKKLEDASKKTTSKITDAVETFFSGKKPAKLALPALSLLAASSDAKSPYHHAINTASQIQADPSGMIDHIGNETASVRKYAPEIADHMASIGSTAAAFLASKAPQNPYIGNTLTPHLHDWSPSRAEISTFRRYADCVFHPLSTLNHLSDNTISHEEIETLQTVYPRIYDQISREAANQLTELKRPLPYSKRVTLSQLLGVPYDSSLQPEMVAAFQQSHLLSQAQEQGGSPNNSGSLSKSGVSKLSKADSLMTDTQRVQTRAM